MFMFTMLIGVLGIICWNMGLSKYFIGLFIAAVIINEIDLYLKKKNQNDMIEEFKSMFGGNSAINLNISDKKEKAKQAAENLTTEAFLKKKQIPVRIDKETGAYIISIDELIEAVDSYYNSEIERIFGNKDENK